MGAFDIGSIRATLGLDESNFVRGMLNAETATEIFGDRVVKFVNNPLLGTLRITKDLARRALEVTRDTVNYNRELDLWARRTGASIELLSGLAPHAEQMRVEVEDLGDAFAEVGVKARDAVLGSEDLLKTFERLGVELTDANGNLRNNGELLLDMAEGLKAVNNQTERAAIVDELLSDVGKRLLPLLQQGRDGIRDLVDESRKLGFVLTEDAASASEDLRGRVNDLSRALKGLQRTGATGFIKGLTSELRESDGSASDLVLRLKEDLHEALENVGTLTGRIAKSDWLRYSLEGATGLLEVLIGVNVELDKIEQRAQKPDPFTDLNEKPGFWQRPISWVGYSIGELLFNPDDLPAPAASTPPSSGDTGVLGTLYRGSLLEGGVQRVREIGG